MLSREPPAGVWERGMFDIAIVESFFRRGVYTKSKRWRGFDGVVCSCCVGVRACGEGASHGIGFVGGTPAAKTAWRLIDIH